MMRASRPIPSRSGAVAPVRTERAGVSVRVLRASDGSVVSFFSDRDIANNLSTPDAILEAMAKKVAKAM
jgi:hypothetical protein